MGYQDRTGQFIEMGNKTEPHSLLSIEMGFNVGNDKMEPDSLLKWVLMLEMTRWNLTVY